MSPEQLRLEKLKETGETLLLLSDEEAYEVRSAGPIPANTSLGELQKPRRSRSAVLQT